MKYLLLLFTFLSPTVGFSSDIRGALEQRFNSKFLDSGDYSYIGKCEALKFGDVVIRHLKKEFKDSATDSDDWYSADSMERFHRELVKEEKANYGFGLDTKVYEIHGKIVVDYLVLSMFEVEDFRFERFIIVFSGSDAEVFQFSNAGDFDIYREELTSGNYLVHRDGDIGKSLIWDYKSKAKDKIIEKIRKGSLELPRLQTLYNQSEEVFEIIKSRV